MERVLVTGANGFVGRALCRYLVERGYHVRGSIRDRRLLTDEDKASEYIETGSLERIFDWSEALDGITYVIHLAAISEVCKQRATEAPMLFQRINVDTSRELALQAAQAGIKRFIYLSTIKVNGELSQNAPITASDRPMPLSPYGKSKLLAEQQVTAVGEAHGLESVVIRPTIIYGPDTGGNILRLMKLIDSGLPIPLGLVENQRSLLSIENLCDLIATCQQQAHLKGQVLLASDGEDISTPGLIRLLADLMGKKPHLWPVPVTLLKLLGTLTFKTEEIRRLTGSLQVDISATRAALDWTPPHRLNDAMRATVDHYLQQ